MSSRWDTVRLCKDEDNVPKNFLLGFKIEIGLENGTDMALSCQWQNLNNNFTLKVKE